MKTTTENTLIELMCAEHERQKAEIERQNAALREALLNLQTTSIGGVPCWCWQKGRTHCRDGTACAGARAALSGAPPEERTCGVWGRTIGPCDLPPGHKSDKHSSDGDGFYSDTESTTPPDYAPRAEVLAEREACAKIADDEGERWCSAKARTACADIADLIRARSKT